MEQTDPLAQLKDIHLPNPVGLWPLAWGWWVLLVLLIAAVALAIFIWRRNKARNRYRAAARAELQHAKFIFDQGQDTAGYLQQVSIILRRAAMSGCADSYHANLKGEAWLQWLDDQSAKNTASFSIGPGRVLLCGPYQKAPEADVESLHKLACDWLMQHRNRWQKKPALPNKSAAANKLEQTNEHKKIISGRAQPAEARTDV